MIGEVKTMLGRLNTRATDGVGDAWPRDRASVTGDGGTTEDPEPSGSAVASPPHLYECPSCEQVYVATETRTCSTCDIPTDRVD